MLATSRPLPLLSSCLALHRGKRPATQAPADKSSQGVLLSIPLRLMETSCPKTPDNVRFVYLRRADRRARSARARLYVRTHTRNNYTSTLSL